MMKDTLYCPVSPVFGLPKTMESTRSRSSVSLRSQQPPGSSNSGIIARSTKTFLAMGYFPPRFQLPCRRMLVFAVWVGLFFIKEGGTLIRKSFQSLREKGLTGER